MNKRINKAKCSGIFKWYLKNTSCQCRQDLKPNQMQNQFLVLTLDKGNQVIIGCSNISLIEPMDADPRKTRITLNYAENSGLFPKTILVTQSFETIKTSLGL